MGVLQIRELVLVFVLLFLGIDENGSFDYVNRDVICTTKRVLVP
jgi:hypothetical protein